MVQRKKKRADRSMWKMSPERLEEHLKLRSRATRIPDKKKEQSRKACRNNRQAFGLSLAVTPAHGARPKKTKLVVGVAIV